MCGTLRPENAEIDRDNPTRLIGLFINTTNVWCKKFDDMASPIKFSSTRTGIAGQALHDPNLYNQTVQIRKAKFSAASRFQCNSNL